MKIFSSICKVSDCVDYNVALIEDLDKNRMPMPDTSGKLTRLPVGIAWCAATLRCALCK